MSGTKDDKQHLPISQPHTLHDRRQGASCAHPHGQVQRLMCMLAIVKASGHNWSVEREIATRTQGRMLKRQTTTPLVLSQKQPVHISRRESKLEYTTCHHFSIPCTQKRKTRTKAIRKHGQTENKRPKQPRYREPSQVSIIASLGGSEYMDRIRITLLQWQQPGAHMLRPTAETAEIPRTTSGIDHKSIAASKRNVSIP